MKSTLYIQNLKCGGCETTIIERLSELKNIDSVSVNLKYDTVNFEHKTKQDVTVAKKLLSKLGYPPFGEKNNLTRKAKSYVSCAVGRIHQKD